MEQHELSLPRTYLAWRKPDEDELGRVELVESNNPDKYGIGTGLTAETVSIPAGCILTLIRERDDLEN